MTIEKIYLGDSVYATLTSYGDISLTTENGLPSDPSNEIILDGSTYKALVEFVERKRKERAV